MASVDRKSMNKLKNTINSLQMQIEQIEKNQRKKFQNSSSTIFGEELWFRVGDIVRINSLIKFQKYHGKLAKVVGYFIPSDGRWPVKLIDNSLEIAIKSENIVLANQLLNLNKQTDTNVTNIDFYNELTSSSNKEVGELFRKTLLINPYNNFSNIINCMKLQKPINKAWNEYKIKSHSLSIYIQQVVMKHLNIHLFNSIALLITEFVCISGNVKLLNLSGGSGGKDNESQYITSDGIIVRSSSPVHPKTSQTWHIGHAFNGEINTNPSFLTKGGTKQTLTFIFPKIINLSHINVYPTCVSRTHYITNYSIDMFINYKWSELCKYIDTKNDKAGFKREHIANKKVKQIRFNLTRTHNHVCLQEIDFFVVD